MSRNGKNAPGINSEAHAFAWVFAFRETFIHGCFYLQVSQR